MCNICRPFVLYNDFLPPTHKKHETWQYLSFGYYDGVFVGDNLCKEKPGNLEGVWDYFLKYSGELDGSFSSQIIFGLRREDDTTNVHEKDLWDDEKERRKFPFLFLSLIQIKNVENTVRDSWKNCAKLEKVLTNDDVRAFTYLTFDSSDVILVLFCRKYSDGACIIDELHRNACSDLRSLVGWNLIYSFTVASIDKNVLNMDGEIEKINDSIDMAGIYLMANEPGSLDKIYDMICEKLQIDKKERNERCKKYSILGCNDEIFILKGIPWNKFLLLYQDTKGVLNHASDDCEKYLLGVTTILGKDNLLETISNNGNVNDSVGVQRLNSVLSKTMRKLCQNETFLSEVSEENVEAIKRSLLQVINSLQKFETTPFHDYLFCSALRPLKMVIDMASEATNEEKVDDFIDSFYEFMKGFDLYVQDFSRPDRQFTQVPDFNIKIYDTPVKLTAFYNAYIYYVKECLNAPDRSEDRHEYEVLACPGITNNMRVREYFKKISDTKRLFLVEIPEKQVYRTKMMMIMLAHEMGHFVGKNIRKREERFKCIKEIIAKIVIKCMQGNLRMKSEGIENKEAIHMAIADNDYWNELERMLKGLLEQDTDEENYFKVFLEVFSDKLYPEDEQQLYMYWKARMYHSDLVKSFLKSRIIYHLRNEKNYFWNQLIGEIYCYWMEREPKRAAERRVEAQELIKQTIDDMMLDSVWNQNLFSVSKAIEKLIEIMKECVADLICILTLELDAESYYETIISSANDQDFDTNFKGNETVVIRSSLVTQCMRHDLCEGDLGFEWGQEELNKVLEMANQEGVEDATTNLVRHIISFTNKYLEKESDEENVSQIINVVDIFFDRDILQTVLRYLIECKEGFKIYSEGENRRRQDELKRVYQLFDADDIEEIALGVQDFTAKYLSELTGNLT